MEGLILNSTNLANSSSLEPVTVSLLLPSSTSMTSIASNASVNQSQVEIDADCIIRVHLENHKDLFHFFMYGVLLNLVGLMGLVGNIISIMILSRPNMRSSINCCFVGLATFDSILLLTSVLMFGVTAVSEYTGHLQWYQTAVFPWVTMVAYPLGIVAQTGSVYLTVTVTVERYVAVCHPLKALTLCTYGRARMYVVAVALFSLLYNLPRFAEVTYKNCDVDGEQFTTVVMTELRGHASYIQVYITWMYLFVMYLLPFISLIVFNAFIYRQVRLANDESQFLTRVERKELTLAVMLLVVVVVFFFCNVLAFIVSVLELFKIDINELTILNNFLVTVNSSVNFIIYCIFGQKFRRLFIQMFCFGALQHMCGPEGRPLESAGVANNSVYGDRMSYSHSRNTKIIRLSFMKNGDATGGANNTLPLLQQKGNVPAPDSCSGAVTSKSLDPEEPVHDCSNSLSNPLKTQIETVPEEVQESDPSIP